LQIKWLLKLSDIPEIKEVPSFSQETCAFLENIIQEFSASDAQEVKKIEKITNHDVKAVEYFLKQKCKSHSEISMVGSFYLRNLNKPVVLQANLKLQDC
jgi:adenylosuccinate lyase